MVMLSITVAATVKNATLHAHYYTPPATQQGIIGSLDCQDGAAIPVLWRGVSPNLCPVVMLGEYRY